MIEWEVLNMDWLDEAAKRVETAKENKMAQEALKEKVMLEYPEKVEQLWECFKGYTSTVSKKIDGISFESNFEQLKITINDVEIHGYVQREEIQGGFYGFARFHIKKNKVGTNQKLHFEKLLLEEENGILRWVYKAQENNLIHLKTFDESDVEKVFKIALAN